jgi:dehydrogenase/reductase SDR family protein 7B
MDYNEKVVWITGASSGIGEHLAYALAEQGAKLILSSRNEKELQRVKNNCHNDSDILIIPLDVTDFGAIPAAVEDAMSKFGKIDILINNAGISQRSLVKDTQLEVDQKIMSINYLGKVAMTKAILPIMLRQGHGQIVVISSVMGKVGVPYRSAYAASKHALHGFFDALRAEVARDNIAITLILPGYVRTNVTINALKGDGSKNNVMANETSKGMSPEIFAQRALKAIARKREEVLIGNKEVYTTYVKRFFPGFLSYMTKRIKFAPEQR